MIFIESQNASNSVVYRLFRHSSVFYYPPFFRDCPLSPEIIIVQLLLLPSSTFTPTPHHEKYSILLRPAEGYKMQINK